MAIEKLGPYHIKRVLGRGGMGSVYEGVHETTEQKVAVKILALAFSDQPRFRERFEVEIETLKRLKHENIVELFAYGAEGNHMFYAMEVVEGKSLFEEMRDGRVYTPREAVLIGMQICSALRHAHDRGIIHRDLKPANLMIDEKRHLKLTDFGIAKLFDGAQMTADGGVIGTADYMAPEQAMGKPVSQRSDLYSLGSVLYALLAGRPPFSAKTLPQVLHALQYDPPEPITVYNSNAPPMLAKLIHKLLAKDPTKRVATAQAVANRLHDILSELPPEPKPNDVSRDETRVDEDDFDIVDDPSLSGDDGLTIAHESAYAKPTSPIPEPPNPQRDDTSQGTVVPPTELHTQFRRPGKPDPLKDKAAKSKSPKQPKSASTDTPASVKSQNESPTNVSPPQGAVRSHELPTADSLPTSAMRDARPPQSPAEPRSSHFTTVEEEQSEIASELPKENLGRILTIAALIGGLLLVIAVGIFFMLPASADTLHGRIEEAAASGEMKDLVYARDDIEEFLDRFPDDERADEVNDLYMKIKNRHISNSFGGNRSRSLAAESPAEQLYEEAMDLAATDPQKATAKLQAIIDVFGNDESESATLAVELSKSQLKDLERKVRVQRERKLAVIQARIKAADELEETDAAAAKRIRAGLLVLYGDEPWAKEALAGIPSEDD